MERVCDRFARCPFYNRVLPEMPHMSDRLMKRYCRGNYSLCARRRAAEVLGTPKVPDNLFPNDQARLAQLIADRPRS